MLEMRVHLISTDGCECRWGPFLRTVSSQDCLHAEGIWLHHLSNISALSLWMGVDFRYRTCSTFISHLLHEYMKYICLFLVLCTLKLLSVFVLRSNPTQGNGVPFDNFLESQVMFCNLLFIITQPQLPSLWKFNATNVLFIYLCTVCRPTFCIWEQ